MSYSVCDIEPIEPMLYGDNRPSRAGEDHLLASQPPSPYTIFGAIGSHIARNMGIEADYGNWNLVKEILGEFIQTDTCESLESFQLLGFALSDQAAKVFFPAPLKFIIRDIGGIRRKEQLFEYRLLAPASPPGPCSLELRDYLECEPVEDIVEEEFFVSETLLTKLLTGETGSLFHHIRFRDDFFREEYRFGLRMINEKNIAEEGIVFNRPYLRFVAGLSGTPPGWRSCGFVAWIKVLKAFDPKEYKTVGYLGGDRRRARFSFKNLNEEIPLSALRDPVLEATADSKGFFAYALTPIPALASLADLKIDDRSPIAAAVGKPVYSSGWIKSKGGQRPRGMIHAMPAGSVLFYEWEKTTNPENKKDIIRKHWLSTLVPGYGCFGFGRILIGVWK